MELRELTCAAVKDDGITKKLLFYEISHAIFTINAPLLRAYVICSIDPCRVVSLKVLSNKFPFE